MLSAAEAQEKQAEQQAALMQVFKFGQLSSCKFFDFFDFLVSKLTFQGATRAAQALAGRCL